MNKALLLVAHGSRRAQSNDEIRSLARQLDTRTNMSFDTVTCAFLELAEPSIAEAITELANEGADHIVVLPYFLADGRHVHDDIPAAVETGRQQTQGTPVIEIAPYLGTAAGMPELALSIAENSDRMVAQ